MSRDGKGEHDRETRRYVPGEDDRPGDRSPVEFDLSPRSAGLLGALDSTGVMWDLTRHPGVETVGPPRRRLRLRVARRHAELLLNIADCGNTYGVMGARDQAGKGMTPREGRAMWRAAQAIRAALLAAGLDARPMTPKPERIVGTVPPLVSRET